MNQVIIHINLPATEAIGLAIIETIRAALAATVVTPAQLDELNAEINQSTDDLTAALTSVAPNT